MKSKKSEKLSKQRIFCHEFNPDARGFCKQCGGGPDRLHGCTDIPRHEKWHIDMAISDFADTMKAKMFKKVDEGFRGWHEPKNKKAIAESLKEHVETLLDGCEEEYVDIANFCMMLHRFKTDFNVMIKECENEKGT